jgi:mannonate dehydratase
MPRIPDLKQTFRWFGPNDPVTLKKIVQTGATGIVTALHDIPAGEIWSDQAIVYRKRMIEEAGLMWSVAESVNVHESIKTAGPERDSYIEKYIKTLSNLSRAGVKTVCYNFMPVLDWTRTSLEYRLPNGAIALLFDATALAAFDLFILKRDGAQLDYTESQLHSAKIYYDRADSSERNLLAKTILAGLPGTDEVFSLPEFKCQLDNYKGISHAELKQHLYYFLRAVIPVAEALGIKMCIHPDDPPISILGLPRIVRNETDLTEIVNACRSPANGITLCTGSLGVDPQNDIPGIIKRLGKHIHFLHLRNVKREADGSFYEADHLGGSTDMYDVMKAVVAEQIRRFVEGRIDLAIPMRPDHGHKLADDIQYDTYPGYALIGRLKGLAELRGLELGIKRNLLAD